jgi:hypothetical protein
MSVRSPNPKYLRNTSGEVIVFSGRIAAHCYYILNNINKLQLHLKGVDDSNNSLFYYIVDIA